MRKIYYYPFHSDENQYCERMKCFFSKYGSVVALNKKNIFKNFFIRRTNDYVVVNWIENSIVEKGNFSYFGFLKVLFLFIYLRIMFKGFIYVKHNNYPHACKSEEVAKTKLFLGLLEKIPKKTIIHSPRQLKKEYYVPHPLYEDISSDEKLNIENKRYVIFGRIVPYKKIEEVIKIFPNCKELIIAGNCKDKEYLNQLQQLADGKGNVKILAKFWSDEEAKNLIRNSEAMLITHNDNDMIVSGSFFYGLTAQSRILSLKTPFLEWAVEELGSEHLKIFDSSNDMMQEILNEKETILIGHKSPNDLFGDNSVQLHLDKIFV